jgi:hypothetical protein
MLEEIRTLDVADRAARQARAAHPMGQRLPGGSLRQVALEQTSTPLPLPVSRRDVA